MFRSPPRTESIQPGKAGVVKLNKRATRSMLAWRRFTGMLAQTVEGFLVEIFDKECLQK